MDAAELATLLNLPIFTILGTGLATVGGVWIKGRWDLKTEQKRLDAALRDRREDHEREDRKEAAAAESQEALSRKAAAESALDGFAEILDAYSKYPDDSEPRIMEDAWNLNYDGRARRLVELIPDTAIREGMADPIDSLADYVNLVTWNEMGNMAGWQAKQIVRLLVKMAGTAARGEAMSGKIAHDLRSVQERYAKLLGDDDGPF